MTPLKLHFYIVKLWFTGLYDIFLFLLKNIDCDNSLEPPRRGGSNEYPQSIFWAEYEKYQNFYLKIFIFWWQKFSIYLNRRVFVINKTESVVFVCFRMFLTPTGSLFTGPIPLYYSLFKWNVVDVESLHVLYNSVDLIFWSFWTVEPFAGFHWLYTRLNGVCSVA